MYDTGFEFKGETEPSPLSLRRALVFVMNCAPLHLLAGWVHWAELEDNLSSTIHVMAY